MTTIEEIRAGKLPAKPLEEWTEEEKEAWDQYARRTADEIAYRRFKGEVFDLRTEYPCSSDYPIGCRLGGPII